MTRDSLARNCIGEMDLSLSRVSILSYQLWLASLVRKYPNTIPKAQRSQLLFHGEINLCLSGQLWLQDPGLVSSPLADSLQLCPACAEQHQRLPCCSTRVPVQVTTPCAPAQKRGVTLQQQHTSCQEMLPCSSGSKSLCIRGPKHCQDEPWHHPSLEGKCHFPVSITQPNSSRFLTDIHIFVVGNSMEPSYTWKNKTNGDSKIMLRWREESCGVCHVSLRQP